ncbi:Sec-independent protein translocase protein TatB [Pseudomonas japonica]|uniref:Sec-independent protein translocase protein TatB n=1 Tax=Pseudomonas japonica TaxID=256466 RepID=UPI0015E27FB1|nr:Sec-independent protein translocase protein TatB [Pseudomonas japonica]MBA1241254.1 Sec-independent protein translocase subunit TatB [Pseudomonas japonica]
MFGISFSELLLVGLVALLVLGPERLPGAARTAGLWIGRLKRSFNSIKTEIERELGADEIRRQLHNEHILSLEQEARKLIDPQGANQASPSIHPPAQAEPPAAAASASVERTGISSGPATSEVATTPAEPLKTEPQPAPRPPQDSTPAP